MRFSFSFFVVEQTGSGFIKVVREGEEGGYKIELLDSHVNAVETEIQPRGYRSNPATNDWVPSCDDYQVQRNRVFII